MDSKSIELSQKLKSSNEDEVYSALIKIGKNYHNGLQKEVEKFLIHDNIELRSGAIRVLGFYWRLPEYEKMAWEIYKNDPDNWVRAVALMAWIGYQEKTNNREILSTLSAILSDKNESEFVRKEAYVGIFVVSNLHTPEWPNIILDNIDTDVDWKLVDKIVKG